eukprot:TRINITY_DN30749_c0_g1_i1.p1 TRINITY_DN30749_c0_g1~~TRINITY_DN30749_c0_g1_i1.p1  ORF type:complete len:375 (+),score=63.91 TRINITY_DN30749_c0_g1_i1:56-1126(+)
MNNTLSPYRDEYGYTSEVHQNALLHENEELRKWLRQSSLSLDRGLRGSEMLKNERDAARREREVAEAKKDRALTERARVGQEAAEIKQRACITQENMQTLVGHISHMSGQCRNFRSTLETSALTSNILDRFDTILRDPLGVHHTVNSRRDPYEAATESLLSLHQEVGNLLIAVRSVVAGKLGHHHHSESTPIAVSSPRPSTRKPVHTNLKPLPSKDSTLAELLRDSSPVSWERSAVRPNSELAASLKFDKIPDPETIDVRQENDELRALLREAEAVKSENQALQEALFLSKDKEEEFNRVNTKMSALEGRLSSIEEQQHSAIQAPPPYREPAKISPPRPRALQTRRSGKHGAIGII